MNQAFTTQHMTPEAIASLLPRGQIARLVNDLPARIKAALLEKSAELECSLKATIARGNLPFSRSKSVEL